MTDTDIQRARELMIDDFSVGTVASAPIREYSDLFTDYMTKTGAQGVVHVAGEYERFM